MVANLRRRVDWTRSRLTPPMFRDSQLKYPQHYSVKHCFRCSVCDDEFTTENARDHVRSFDGLCLVSMLILLKHYNAFHRWVKCPECGVEFRNKEAMNQVQVFPFSSPLSCLRLFSTTPQNTGLNAQSVIVCTRRGPKWIRSIFIQRIQITSSPATPALRFKPSYF